MPAKRKSKPKCMTKGCNRTDILGMGNCTAHYQSKKRLVDMGRATWEQYIAKGEAKPSRSQLKQSTQPRS